MHADGTSQLCDTGDRYLYLLSCRDDEVGKLVDDDDDVWHKLMTVVRVKMSAEELLVVFLDIACSCFLQKVVASVHESTKTFQGLDNLLRVGNNRLVHVLVDGSHEVVGDRCIDTELYLLRIYKHKLQFVWMFLVEK